VHIVAALADRYRGEVDAIVLRSLNESRQNTFRSLGFIRRPFDAPNGWLSRQVRFLPDPKLVHRPGRRRLAPLKFSKFRCEPLHYNVHLILLTTRGT